LDPFYIHEAKKKTS